ncbi:glutaminase B [Shewanella xiamenensis]|jgi:glutaminase|uniref:Glutaminase n=8 Tax=Shewanella TaxID=22 RepID=GLSA_SHESA|nr:MULTISPECIES: glutaminase B [Shewanella]A0KUF0.1 RecName: Full=Glutaminase [Shewanella sp. ANA-3]Q0HL04.1 RecName: Full=Glutaminase [Shewanella sp. MR-4]Q0HXA2.1 RecName: Full=Glutaminase [Shewanella sp. MR-7]QXN23928.1 glutaminase B [Shewanella putrefaciens]ABI38263.1 Glutaminase [Shewanella sp. MR-4]ABK47419.1 glutaminase [Shewanella sp. ANA-3]ASF17469.1 glutaminase [Shewanella sp. FDAARGOS_354]ASK70013.1 glutaminase [Shewanella bicestrii]
MPEQALLEEVVDKVRPLLGQGKVANYIPALANVDAGKLGIAVTTIDGETIGAGDYLEPFSIQSISKVFSLTLALTLYEETEIWSRVGKEPSGHSFNSLVQVELERGKPRNPFINAGALVIADLLQSRLGAPKHRMLELVRALSQNDKVCFDKQVADSEYQHSARNAAIAYLMKSFGNFQGDVDTVLRTYFHYCALKMNCADLSRAMLYLANRGKTLDGTELISQVQTRQLNALLATSGLYDGAGEFAYRVGMPGKSGVGGGIIAVIPGELSVCVWSPELDNQGNSLAGTAMLEHLSQRLGRSIF